MRLLQLDHSEVNTLNQPYPGAVEAIKQHALSEAPNEACGFIIDGEYHPERNTHSEPLTNFRIPKDQYAKAHATGKLQALVHSHVDIIEFPSKQDMKSQVAMDIPWGLCVIRDQDVYNPIWWGDGVVAPLIGRPFIYGIYDCYSLIRDFYSIQYGEELPEFPREWDFWNKGEDMYVQGFKQAGFHEITQAEALPGDVFLSRVRSDIPNHGGVYVGGGKILHHLINRLSRRDDLIRWGNNITHWLRHDARADDWEINL